VPGDAEHVHVYLAPLVWERWVGTGGQV
jgi:hypothetical protein